MPTPAVKAVLFDKDGTLVDFHKSWGPVAADAATLAARGDERLRAELLAVGGLDSDSGLIKADSLLAASNTTEIAEAFIAAGAQWHLDTLVRDLDTLFTASADRVVPVADLADLLGGLKARGLKLGVASSDNEASIRRSAAVLGFDHLIDFVAGYDSGHGVKPEPGMLAAFAHASGLEAADVAMVGDNRHDMAMARAAGAGHAIGVLTGTGTAKTFEGWADIVLPSISHLPGWLDDAL